ncbi:MAG: low molecular weight protein arginine phosphatase [Defluviitaleaceae bacterium]|nr:low molecular weight protein arginine phosphatase [Defluviitaleaceae bacterium]
MILFVCTGNTCRSPMAAVMASKLLVEAGLDYTVRSAGVSASPECKASAHAVTVMREEGCDLLSHRSQRVTGELVSQADLVLAMTSGHRAAVVSAYPFAADKTFVLCEYAESGNNISDPFGGDYGTYRECASQIKTQLERCIKKIKETGL